MKTKILKTIAISVMIFTIQNAQAQLNYGIHGGLNLATQAEMGELWNNCDVHNGYLVGGVLEYKTGKIFSIQTELNYQQKGTKTDFYTNGTSTVNRKEYNYLTVPLLARATINDKGSGERYNLTFFAGPYAGFLTSAYSRMNEGGENYPVDINDQAEKFDAGAAFGGGIVYNLVNGGAIIAELRYEMGLKSIDKQDPDLRNKSLGLTVGYRF